MAQRPRNYLDRIDAHDSSIFEETGMNRRLIFFLQSFASFAAFCSISRSLLPQLLPPFKFTLISYVTKQA
jgi:hypothetical protein